MMFDVAPSEREFADYHVLLSIEVNRNLELDELRININIGMDIVVEHQLLDETVASNIHAACVVFCTR